MLVWMWPCRVQPRRSSSPPTASWLVSSWYDEFRSYRVWMREQDRVDFAEAAFGPVLERARVERLPALRSSARTDRGGRTSMSSVLVLPGEPSASTLGIRSTAEVLRRTLRCPAAVPSRVERQHAHPGRGPVGDAVRHPTDGTQLEVPVPRSSSSSDIDEGRVVVQNLKAISLSSIDDGLGWGAAALDSITLDAYIQMQSPLPFYLETTLAKLPPLLVSRCVSHADTNTYARQLGRTWRGDAHLQGKSTRLRCRQTSTSSRLRRWTTRLGAVSTSWTTLGRDVLSI